MNAERRWPRAVACIAALGLALLTAGAAARTLDRALRLDAAGMVTPVTLPDRVAGEPDAAVRATWRVDFETGDAPPPGLALYASGLVGRPRIVLNGALLVDETADPAAPPPRALGLLRTVELPAVLLRPGPNTVEITLARRGFASLSALELGERAAMRRLHERKALAMVVGPALVATAIGVLGLATGVLWLRRRHETTILYFSLGATLWSLHTFWTVAPVPLLAGDHLTVWWTTLYAALVVMLSLFCLRFAQRWRRELERALLGALAAVPVLLYAAGAAGVLAPAAEAVRLALVVIVSAALAVVAWQAWNRRRLDGALLVASGFAGAGLGLRDWLVFRGGGDNLPVPWTPYAGLPFIALVSWLLIDRFVRATTALETVNRQLEQRVARREAELSDNFERVAALERAQAAADERQRILRELHDGLGAKLFTSLTKVEAGALGREQVAAELRACLADMRLAIETLTPGTTELGAALGNFLGRWDELLREAGVVPRWQVELPPEGLPIAPRDALALLRVMQEALNNVLRHAHAHRVTLQLALEDAALRLRIDDDGVGLPPDATTRGRGLAAMRGRADALVAQFAVHGAPGGGTRVELRLPQPRR